MWNIKRKIIAGLAALLVCGAAVADTFYLHAGKTSTVEDDVTTIWFDDPVAGTDMATLGADFAGNEFDLNNFTYQTRNTSGSRSFPGEMVSRNSAILQYCGTFTLGGLDWSNTSGTRDYIMRRSNAKLNITTFSVTDTMLVRANSSEKNLELTVSQMSGSGNLVFGRDNDESTSLWELDIDDSGFAGTIRINRGVLRFNDNLLLNKATLEVADSTYNSVVLANNATFGDMIYNGVAVAAGEYTASALNSLLGTSEFSGSGTLIVVPTVDTIRVETAADGSGAVVSATSLDAEDTLTVYAIGRASNGSFVANVPASWSLINKTGFVVDANLAPAADNKSAVLTAGGFGTGKIAVSGKASTLVNSGLISMDAAPVLSANRPVIWVRGSERSGILDKIESQAWARTQVESLMERVAPNLVSYAADRDGFLRELPVNWAASPAVFNYNTVRYSLGGKLNQAVDASVLYYLTGDPAYARFAADILHNSAKALADTPVVNTHVLSGWLFDQDLLLEARVIGDQMPLIYDFLEPYLQGSQVYDVKLAGMTSFAFTDAQFVFKKYTQLVRDHGYSGSNWSAMMSPCLVQNALGLENATDRANALDVYLTDGGPRQDSLEYDYHYFPTPDSIAPESLQYVGVYTVNHSYLMSVLDRYDSSLNLFATYPNMLFSLSRVEELAFPSESAVPMFGDGPRNMEFSAGRYEFVYRVALDQGLNSMADYFGGLIETGLSEGYDRSVLGEYGLGPKTSALGILWGVPTISETPVDIEIPTTDTVPHAGLALQRNVSSNGDPDYALMSYVSGAAYVHSHASGMNMELYGLGDVLGTSTYGKGDYARTFAANNTVVVNGYSRGDGGWKDLAINTVQQEAMEPAAFTTAVSPNHSFTCSSFLDDKGTGAEATQQRTMAIVRTSPTTGYYVDIFRSNSSLGGEYHDYIYHNIGDSLSVEDSSGTPLSLSSAPNRFVNDTSDPFNAPGWGDFTSVMASATVTDSVRAQFVTSANGAITPMYMDLHIPGDSAREYVTAQSPAVLQSTTTYYDNRTTPTLVVRKTGEAWDRPFATIFEPHYGTAGSVRNTAALEQGGKVVGMQVESTVGGDNIVQYVISNTGANDTYLDVALGIEFTGRFAVVTDNGDGTGELYIGEGSYLNFGGLIVSSVSGNNTEASVLFNSSGATSTTANDPVTVANGDPPSANPDEVLTPVADAYVRGGTYANNNYGTSVKLENKESTNSKYDRQSHLRFDLSQLSGVIASAKLRLKVQGLNGPDTHTAKFISDDSWVESGITWNNAPSAGASLASGTTPSSSGEWFELDVTDQVVTEFAGDGLFSTVIVPSGNIAVNYHSRDAATSADRPQLVITFAQTLNPVADAYVRGGTYANNNYGSSDTLDNKNSSSNYDRQSHLRFDLSSVSGSVGSAKLRLKVKGLNGPDTHTAHFVSNDSWGESTITWNNAPNAGSSLASGTTPSAAGEWFELDVTAQVATEFAGDGLFSTVIVPAGNIAVNYHSSEAADPADRPQLVILPAAGAAAPAAAPLAMSFSMEPIQSSAVLAQPVWVSDSVASQIAVEGTVSGTLAETEFNDNAYQTITEIKKDRTSALEHKWVLNVTGSELVTFYLEAHHSANSEGDDFVFAWSTDDVNYTDMVTVSKTADDDTAQYYALPSGLSGTVYVRVLDADRTRGNTRLDSISVDFITVVSEEGAAPQ